MLNDAYRDEIEARMQDVRETNLAPLDSEEPLWLDFELDWATEKWSIFYENLGAHRTYGHELIAEGRGVKELEALLEVFEGPADGTAGIKIESLRRELHAVLRGVVSKLHFGTDAEITLGFDVDYFNRRSLPAYVLTADDEHDTPVAVFLTVREVEGFLVTLISEPEAAAGNLEVSQQNYRAAEALGLGDVVRGEIQRRRLYASRVVNGRLVPAAVR